MSQEHGYQRSGKKCREKFENLYKYYKKTKEGKAGRQDGKHYRFFRQLEALYGDTAAHFHHHAAYNFPNQEPYPLPSKISDASECDTTTTSSYCTDSNAGGEDDARMRKRKGKMRSMKAEIEAQMRSMSEKQEEWMERMTRAIEGKEQERLMREEQWRRQDAARIDGEHKMWAAERAWIESRDAALMDAFHKLAGRDIDPPPPPPPLWSESEAARPIQLRTTELRFDHQEEEAAAWDEIAAKMAACGGDRSKLDHFIGDYLIKCSKKRKEGNDQKHGIAGAAANANDGVFRYFIGDSYQRL